MNNKIFLLIVSVLIIWSSSIFAVDEKASRSPITFYFGSLQLPDGRTHTCIRYMFSQQTLQEIFQGDFLKKPTIEDCREEILTLMHPSEELGYICRDRKFPDIEIKEIYFFSAQDRQPFFSEIKRILHERGLKDFMDDRTHLHAQWQNHPLAGIVDDFCQKGFSESLFPPHAKFVLSCGDNAGEHLSINPVFQAAYSSSFRVASYCNSKQQKLDLLLAGDINAKGHKKFLCEDQQIESIPLDHLKPLQEQLGQFYPPLKFQFILGRKLLCSCQKKLCCGGFDLEAEPSQVLQFLQNLANILDESSDSVAILTGHRPIEGCDFDRECQIFNQEHLVFEVLVLRNRFGEFCALLMHRKISHRALAPHA